MRSALTCVTGAVLATVTLPAAGSAQVGYDAAIVHPSDAIEVEIWTEHGDDYVYGHEDDVAIHFRTVDDAFVIVYGTDADGAVHLLYPTQREHRRRVRRDRIYTIDAYDLHAAGAEGVVYVEALACAYPLEPHLPAFFYDRGPRHRPHRAGRQTALLIDFGWVVGDPYVAFAALRGRIVPRGCAPRYVSYATLSFSIGSKRYYPRYVCNDCHWGGWYDPYHDSCSVFEIRVDSFWGHAYPYYDHCQPRYFYWKRASVPVRYRHYKTKWSSKDRSDDMIRYFAGKSPREQDHLSAHTKPTLGDRGGRGRDTGVKPGRGGGRGRPEDVRGKPTKKPPVLSDQGGGRGDRDRPRGRTIDRPRDRDEKPTRVRDGKKPDRRAPEREKAEQKKADRKDDRGKPDRKVKSDRGGKPERGGGEPAAKPGRSRGGDRKAPPPKKSRGGSRRGSGGGGR